MPAFGRTIGVLADDEEEEVEDGFVRLLLREEDLKAETAMEGGDGELEVTQWIMGEIQVDLGGNAMKDGFLRV